MMRKPAARGAYISQLNKMTMTTVRRIQHRIEDGLRIKLCTDLAFKLWTRLRDIARAVRRDRDARNTRSRVERTQHKGQICMYCASSTQHGLLIVDHISLSLLAWLTDAVLLTQSVLHASSLPPPSSDGDLSHSVCGVTSPPSFHPLCTHVVKKDHEVDRGSEYFSHCDLACGREGGWADE